MRKCKHNKQRRIAWIDHEAIAAHCADCGERLSLGASNDIGCEVEIEAARRLVSVGYPDADVWFEGDAYLIVADCDETNATAYAWDPTRPLAEQGLGPDEHGPGCDKQTDDAFPCNANCARINQRIVDLEEGLSDAAYALQDAGDPEAAADARAVASPALVEVPIETDHAIGCEVGPYRIGRCELCDTEPLDEPEAFDLTVAAAPPLDMSDPVAAWDDWATDNLKPIEEFEAGRAEEAADEERVAAPAQLLAVPVLANEGPPSGFVAWPPDEPRQYNGSGEPCDMWIGPCLCGATHTADQRLSESLRDLEQTGGGS